MSKRRHRSEPKPLSGLAMGLLSAHQRKNAIPDPAFERGLRRIEAYQRAESSRRTRRLVVMVGVATALAAALILGLLAPSMLRETRPGTPEQAPFEHDNNAAEVPTTNRPAKTTTAPAPAGAPSAATPAAAEPTPTPTVRPRPRPPKRLPPKSSTLAEERSVLQRAWQALAQGDPATALSEAAEHERRFAAGVLANERAAIEAIADCKRGGADPGRRAARYLRRTPDALLSGAVREACAEFFPESRSP